MLACPRWSSPNVALCWPSRLNKGPNARAPTALLLPMPRTPSRRHVPSYGKRSRVLMTHWLSFRFLRPRSPMRRRHLSRRRKTLSSQNGRSPPLRNPTWAQSSCRTIRRVFVRRRRRCVRPMRRCARWKAISLRLSERWKVGSWRSPMPNELLVAPKPASGGLANRSPTAQRALPKLINARRPQSRIEIAPGVISLWLKQQEKMLNGRAPWPFDRRREVLLLP